MSIWARNTPEMHLQLRPQTQTLCNVSGGSCRPISVERILISNKRSATAEIACVGGHYAVRGSGSLILYCDTNWKPLPDMRLPVSE